MKIIVSGPFTSWQINGETMETVTNFIFLGSQITADGDYSHEIKRCLLPGRKAITNLDNVLKNRHYFANKGPFNQSCGFFSCHIWLWVLNQKEGRALMNWCFWTVVSEKIRESPLDCEEIQPVHPKGNQSWILIGRTDTEAETPILWPPNVKSHHLKRLWCWERLRVGGEGDDRGLDGWMVSPTQWIQVWAGSRRWL